jgi:predicted DCC family thiol-disulfide oxidoreductase YuxK
MLLVLYDSACPFCARCREWLEAREHEVPLAFLCCRTRGARERYGRIEGLGRELVVVDEHGRYWIGPEAFLVCGWALSAWRWLALLGASALFGWIAKPLFRWISDNRGALGGWIGAPPCTGEHCGLPPARSPYR